MFAQNAAQNTRIGEMGTAENLDIGPAGQTFVSEVSEGGCDDHFTIGRQSIWQPSQCLYLKTKYRNKVFIVLK